MTHQMTASEDLETLELVETNKHSEEKFKKLTKDVLGLRAEGDLILHAHIPEIVERMNSMSESLIILRDDYSDTNRLVRKMYYETLPSLHLKIDNLTSKVDTLCSKLEEYFK